MGITIKIKFKIAILFSTMTAITKDERVYVYNGRNWIERIFRHHAVPDETEAGSF